MPKAQKTMLKRRLLLLVPAVVCLLFAFTVVVRADKVQAVSQILCVDANGGSTGGAPCANTTAFTTMNAAIATALPGDQLLIAAGTYSGACSV